MEEDWLQIPESLVAAIRASSNEAPRPSLVLPIDKADNDKRDDELSCWVRILPNVRDATAVVLEPLSISDYAKLHIHAQWLEEGGLLQQVSLVYQGQILDLSLPYSPKKNKRTCAHSPYHNRNQMTVEIAQARVISLSSSNTTSNLMKQNDETCRELEKNSRQGNRCCGFSTDGHMRQGELEWPEDDETIASQDSSFSHSPSSLYSEYSYRRLLANARIVVLEPKPTEKDTEQGAILLQPCPTWHDYSPSMHEFAKQKEQEDQWEARTQEQQPVKLPNVPTPNTALVHPKIAQEIYARISKNWPTEEVTTGTRMNRHDEEDNNNHHNNDDDPTREFTTNGDRSMNGLVRIARVASDTLQEGPDDSTTATGTTSSRGNALVQCLIVRLATSEDLPSSRHIGTNNPSSSFFCFPFGDLLFSLMIKIYHANADSTFVMTVSFNLQLILRK